MRTIWRIVLDERQRMETCPHVMLVRPDVRPSGQGCKECLALGTQWVHLRLCMICGHVGCCDSSPGRHATAHYAGTGHPIIKPFEPGDPPPVLATGVPAAAEDWWWCFVDEIPIEPPFPPDPVWTRRM
jgi:hypothetical protein